MRTGAPIPLPLILRRSTDVRALNSALVPEPLIPTSPAPLSSSKRMSPPKVKTSLTRNGVNTFTPRVESPSTCSSAGLLMLFELA